MNDYRLNLYFHRTYDHCILQIGELRWTTASTSNSRNPWITWSGDHSTNEERYISVSSRSVAPKRDKEVTSNGKTLSTKLDNSLITWTHQVIWQIKNIPRDLWPLNQTGWWLKMTKLQSYFFLLKNIFNDRAIYFWSS